MNTIIVKRYFDAYKGEKVMKGRDRGNEHSQNARLGGWCEFWRRRGGGMKGWRGRCCRGAWRLWRLFGIIYISIHQSLTRLGGEDRKRGGEGKVILLDLINRRLHRNHRLLPRHLHKPHTQILILHIPRKLLIAILILQQARSSQT